MSYLLGNTSLPMKLGVLLAILTILYGFSLGIMFAEFEEKVVNSLKGDAASVLDTAYNGDTDFMNRTVSKSMHYLLRAHIHANGLGIGALVLIIGMILLTSASKLRDLSSLFLGIGALGYSTFWMITGFLAPGMGGIKQAKGAVGWYAMLTVIICSIGILLSLFMFFRATFFSKAK